MLKIVFTISPGLSGHRCASLRISPGIAGHLLFLQARMVAHRRSSPGIAGASRISFFLQDYIVFYSCLTISPGIAGHRWHRCLSCQGHLSWHPWASLRIAGHRIAAYLSWHRWASAAVNLARLAPKRVHFTSLLTTPFAARIATSTTAVTTAFAKPIVAIFLSLLRRAGCF